MIAFDSIFKKYYPILCAYGNRFVDYEESKEIAGDAILWLWEHRETLQVETSLGRYMGHRTKRILRVGRKRHQTY